SSERCVRFFRQECLQEVRVVCGRSDESEWDDYRLYRRRLPGSCSSASEGLRCCGNRLAGMVSDHRPSALDITVAGEYICVELFKTNLPVGNIYRWWISTIPAPSAFRNIF